MQIQLDRLKDKKILAVLIFSVFLIIVLAVLLSLLSGAKKKEFYMPTIGYLSDFDRTMKDNPLIEERVNQILSYDEVYLFVNYREINGTIAEILFFWAGLTPENLKTMKAGTLIDNFIRRVFSVPAEEPVKNNPFLGKDPWPTILGRFKSRLLMQGNGYKIYDGPAYYDGEKDEIIIEGTLSKAFIKGFSQFILTQEKGEQKRYVNNFLSFINQTKGFENLNAEEKELLKSLN